MSEQFLISSESKRWSRNLVRRCLAGGIGVVVSAALGCAGTEVGPPSVWSTSQHEIRGQEPNLLSNLRNRILPKSPTELVQLAHEQYGRGEFQAALNSLQSARRMDPRLVTTWVLETEIAIDLDDRERALRALQALQDASPQAARTQFEVALRYQQLNALDRATKAFERAHRLEPRRIEFARAYAAALLAQGEKTGAIEILQRSLQRNSNSLELAVLLGRLHEEQRDWAAAADAYEIAVEQSDGQTQWRRRRGRCQYLIGRYHQAAEDLAYCYLHDPKSLSFVDLVYYGDACLRIDDVSSASVVFDELAKNTPRRVREVELMRAICAVRGGRPQAAKEILRAARAKWPQDAHFAKIEQLVGGRRSGSPPNAVQQTAFHQEIPDIQSGSTSAEQPDQTVPAVPEVDEPGTLADVQPEDERASASLLIPQPETADPGEAISDTKQVSPDAAPSELDSDATHSPFEFGHKERSDTDSSSEREPMSDPVPELDAVPESDEVPNGLPEFEPKRVEPNDLRGNPFEFEPPVSDQAKQSASKRHGIPSVPDRSLQIRSKRTQSSEGADDERAAPVPLTPFVERLGDWDEPDAVPSARSRRDGLKPLTVRPPKAARTKSQSSQPTLSPQPLTRSATDGRSR